MKGKFPSHKDNRIGRERERQEKRKKKERETTVALVDQYGR